MRRTACYTVTWHAQKSMHSLASGSLDICVLEGMPGRGTGLCTHLARGGIVGQEAVVGPVEGRGHEHGDVEPLQLLPAPPVSWSVEWLAGLLEEVELHIYGTRMACLIAECLHGCGWDKAVGAAKAGCSQALEPWGRGRDPELTQTGLSQPAGGRLQQEAHLHEEETGRIREEVGMPPWLDVYHWAVPSLPRT